MSDHLTAEQIAFYQTATSLEASVEDRKIAVEELLKWHISREMRVELLIILKEICPLDLPRTNQH